MSRVANPDTQRLGEGSIGRVDEKAVVQNRIREESSHITHRVTAKVSIHVFPGQRYKVERS